MIAAPLEVPLRTLAPNRLVWIQRGGLVYPYPARIVRDIANDLYVGDEFDPSELDSDVSTYVGDAYWRGTNRNTLRALCASAWNGSLGSSIGFDVWWDSVDDNHQNSYIVGAAASYAARNVLTWSLFKHRYMIDTPSQSL